MLKQEITIKINSNINTNPKLKKTIKTLAKQTNLQSSQFTSFKKKNKLLLSLISGPHVHKKSRDQYYLQELSTLVGIKINNQQDLKNFNVFKSKLYQLNQGFQLKFTYLKNE